MRHQASGFSRWVPRNIQFPQGTPSGLYPAISVTYPPLADCPVKRASRPVCPITLPQPTESASDQGQGGLLAEAYLEQQKGGSPGVRVCFQVFLARTVRSEDATYATLEPLGHKYRKRVKSRQNRATVCLQNAPNRPKTRPGDYLGVLGP